MPAAERTLSMQTNVMSSRACLRLSLFAACALLSSCSALNPFSSNSDSNAKANRAQLPTAPLTAEQQAASKALIGKSHTELASAYYAAGQYQTAAEVIGRALAANPNDTSTLAVAGLIYAELRDMPKANAYFDQALAINPKDPDLNHNYGAFLCKQGDPARAMPYFKAALEVPTYNRPANTLATAGGCLAKLGRDEEALQYFTAALRFDALHAAALIGMADLQFQRGALQEAEALMTRFARVSRASPESLFLQLRIARNLGKKADERQYAIDLRTAFPQSAQTRMIDGPR